MSEIRVGIVNKGLPSNVKRQLSIFKSSLKEFDFEIDIILPDCVRPLQEFHFDGYFKKGSIGFKRDLKLAKNCVDYVREKSPDVVMNFTAGAIPYVKLIETVFGVSSVVRITGEPFKRKPWKNALRKEINYLYSRIVKFKSLNDSSGIICLGPFLKKKFSHLGFDSYKIKVIPPFLDRSKFHPPKDKLKLKEKLGFPEKKVILFVGRLDVAKGANILDEVIKRVTERSDDMIFCLIGEGTYKKELAGYKNTKCLGGVDFREIDKYYKASDLLILPSYSEGLPNVVLEALACKVPVVATPIGEIPWLVSNICRMPEEFSKFILKSKWRLDNLPDIFDNKKLIQQYNDLFMSISEEKSIKKEHNSDKNFP